MEDEIEFSDYYRTLKENWLMVMITFIIVLGAVMVYTFAASPVYEAKSRVMVTGQDQTSALLGQPMGKVDLGTQREIILSASVLNQVYQDHNPESFTIAVENLKDTAVMEIRIDSSNAEEASAIANKVADSYVNYSRESKKADAQQVTSFITEQVDKYGQEIKDLNTMLFVYRNKTGLSSDQMIKAQTLNDELAAKEKLYNYLLSRREEASISANERLGSAKVIEYAATPIHFVKPNIMLNLAIGVVLACIAGFAIVYPKANLSKIRKNKKA
jgi:uncharacterized protein involved in exopolysaccharide biosynthesis